MEIEIRCTCGQPLDGNFYFNRGVATFDLEECPKCAKKHEAEKEASYDEGRRDAEREKG